MNDILNTADLNLLVDKFYQKLLSDSSISYIFTDVVKIKLAEHLPILVTFWSQAIFNTGGYFKNLTQIHLDISEKEYLTPETVKLNLENHYWISNSFISKLSKMAPNLQQLSLRRMPQITNQFFAEAFKEL